MAQQDNKPNNDTLQAMEKPDRMGKKGQENQAQEFINETDKNGSPNNRTNTGPSTAEHGGQPRTSQLKDTNEMGRNG